MEKMKNIFSNFPEGEGDGDGEGDGEREGDD
jgi:hypothetical protein